MQWPVLTDALHDSRGAETSELELLGSAPCPTPFGLHTENAVLPYGELIIPPQGDIKDKNYPDVYSIATAGLLLCLNAD